MRACETAGTPFCRAGVALGIFMARHDAKTFIGRCVDGFYNPVQRHLSLDVVSPAAHERLVA